MTDRREFRIVRPDGEVWAEGSASLADGYIAQMEPGDVIEYRTVTDWRQEPSCKCARCTPVMYTMRVCRVCGNKRCPHAADHDNECTRSNEPGQPGSLYPRIPPMSSEEVAKHFQHDGFRCDPVELVRRIRDGGDAL